MCLEQGNDGWTVIQRRVSDAVAFHHMGWEDYKDGFGDYRYNYWIGLEKLHHMTSSDSYELFVGLHDQYAHVYRHAVYESFAVASEDQNYMLTVGDWDSSRSTLVDSLSSHSGTAFTTHDRDNDDHQSINCAHQGDLYYGGWWFRGNDCLDANLNGQYITQASTNQANGILWQGINEYSKAATIMAIRRI